MAKITVELEIDLKVLESVKHAFGSYSVGEILGTNEAKADVIRWLLNYGITQLKAVQENEIVRSNIKNTVWSIE